MQQYPAPFLRWAGSKRKLLPKLVPVFSQPFDRYIEPFMGSAVLYFALQPKRAVLGDLNADLVSTFEQVRDHPRKVYNSLMKLPKSSESYYRIRGVDPSDLSPADASARFIFLNRFCFNGLYRTNQRGEFNVPYSPSRSGQLPTWNDLKLCASALQTTKFVCGDFESLVLRTVKRGDFVYLDPPFAVTKRRVFKQYGGRQFQIDDLARLEKVLEHIDSTGARFLLSYAYCKEALSQFSRWPVKRVMTQRNISGFARHRRKAAELLFSNATNPEGESLLWSN